MQPKKIILIRPNLKTNYDLTPPVGIISIGGFLTENGCKVKIIDLMARDDYKTIIKNQIQDCLFIGISVMTAHIPSALDIAKFIKSINKKIKVVWGGIHPTLYPEQTISNPYVDIVAKGEGEYICLDLVRCLKENRDLRDVPAIVYKDKESNIIVSQNSANPINLDKLPFLNYNLINIEKYVNKNIDPTFSYSFTGITRRHLSVIGGMGCKFRCAFCVNPIIYKRTQKVKSANRLLDEIEYLMREHNVCYFYIRDEDFFGDKERVMKFLEGIEKRNLRFKWYTNIRAAYFKDNYINENILAKMEKLGLYQFSVGAESGSQKVLDVLKKDTLLEDIERVAYVTKDTNIIVIFSFMIGMPGEDVEDVLKTIKFIKKLKKINPKSFIIGPQLYRPYPGTALFDLCIEKGFSQPQTLEDWQLMLDRYSGYLSPKDLPWIEQSEQLNLIYFYSRVMFKSVKTLKRDARIVLKVPLFFILKFIAEIRLIFDFWVIPLENIIYNTFTKVFRFIQVIKKHHRIKLYRKWLTFIKGL